MKINEFYLLWKMGCRLNIFYMVESLPTFYRSRSRSNTDRVRNTSPVCAGTGYQVLRSNLANSIYKKESQLLYLCFCNCYLLLILWWVVHLYR